MKWARDASAAAHQPNSHSRLHCLNVYTLHVHVRELDGPNALPDCGFRFEFGIAACGHGPMAMARYM
jgi:hypothetical protein